MYDDTRKKIKNLIDGHKEGKQFTERDVHTFYEWLVNLSDMRNVCNITVLNYTRFYSISLYPLQKVMEVIMNRQV